MTAGEWTLQYEITSDALVDVVRLRLSPIYPLINVAVGMLLVAAVSMVGIGAAIESLRGIWLVAALLILVAGLVFAMLRNRRLLQWQVGRGVQPGVGPAELTCGADGLHLTTRAGTFGISWTELTGLRDDSRTVVFERQGRLSVWVPHAAFASQEQRQAFIRYAQDSIANASIPQ